MTDRRPRLSLDDVLNLKYPGPWEWSPDGRFIAYILDDGGKTDLWVVTPEGGGPVRVSSATEGVSAFSWRPAPAGRPDPLGLAYVQDGQLWVASEAPSGFAGRALLAAKRGCSSPLWSPDGRRLGYVYNEGLWLYEPETGLTRELSVPGKLRSGFGGTSDSFAWSPKGALIAAGYGDEYRIPHVAVIDPDAGEKGLVLWQSSNRGATHFARWLDERSAVYMVPGDDDLSGDLFTLGLPGIGAGKAAGAPGDRDRPAVTHLLRIETDGRGSPVAHGVVPTADGRRILLTFEKDGWVHHFLHDRDSGQTKQLTFGECEDFGFEGDEPAWSPDGKLIAYASNRAASGERHLWLLDPTSGDERRLAGPYPDLPATDTQPKWSPDGRWLAFVHCDPYRSGDLWVMPAPKAVPAARAKPAATPNDEPHQLTFSMPPAWAAGPEVATLEEVTFKGALDWDIHGTLVKWSGLDLSGATRYPAIVWVHGGPVRQMRPTFNPMGSYALFDAFHRYLSQLGYVILNVNYRGGIGYGEAFRNGLYHKMGVDDVLDVVSAGRFLKTLPYVDPSRVAVWGISYGGYMTLHALTQYPDEFVMGTNLAGIWDFRQWMRWVEGRWGRSSSFFKTFLGGDPEESPEIYRQASPCTFIDGMKAPLINFHGTADANVDFAQLDKIVKDCIEHGKKYEAYYYPDEGHVFGLRKTWVDAFPKIIREFERYLKP